MPVSDPIAVAWFVIGATVGLALLCWLIFTRRR